VRISEEVLMMIHAVRSENSRPSKTMRGGSPVKLACIFT
jgi:hypothetical protein